MFPGSRKYLIRIDDIYKYLIQCLQPMQNKNFYKTGVGKEFTKNYLNAVQMAKDNNVSIWKNSENPFNFSLKHQKKTYKIISSVPACDCNAFIYKQRHASTFSVYICI